MKTWYNVTLEDLTLPEGGWNQELINKLDLIEYIDEIDDLVEWGINDDPVPAMEQIKCTFMKIFIEMNRIINGNVKSTEPEDMTAYLESQEVADKIERVLKLSMSVTPETWPDVKKKLLDDAGIVDDRSTEPTKPIDPKYITGFRIL